MKDVVVKETLSQVTLIAFGCFLEVVTMQTPPQGSFQNFNFDDETKYTKFNCFQQVAGACKNQL